MKSKAALLIDCLGRSPREFADRLFTAVEGRLDRFTRVSSPDTVEPEFIHDRLGITDQFKDGALSQTEAEIKEDLAASPTFYRGHNPNVPLGRFCYAVCRHWRPDLVIETGVGFGVTSTFILKALAINGRGKLESIDLPPLSEGADEKAGALVPSDLRDRWLLHRGRARRLLPMIANRPIDVFLHDSLHTLRNMGFEYETAWLRLRPGGILISDDVFANRAFETFTRRPDIEFAAVEKNWRFGVAVKSCP